MFKISVQIGSQRHRENSYCKHAVIPLGKADEDGTNLFRLVTIPVSVVCTNACARELRCMGYRLIPILRCFCVLL